MSDFKAFEVAGWSRPGKAAAYDAVVGGVTRPVAQALLDTLGVGAGDRFLDVATGPGYLAGAAAARGASAVGVDVSPDMVALARVRVPEAEFLVADAEDLPFENGSFDAAAAAFVLHHVPRPERVVSELCRVAGAAAVAHWDSAERMPIFGLMADAAAEVGLATPADLPRGPSRDALAADSALRALFGGEAAVTTLTFDHAFPSAEVLFDGFLDGSVNTAALVRSQPPELQVRLREAFTRRADAYGRGGELVLPVSVKIARSRLR